MAPVPTSAAPAGSTSPLQATTPYALVPDPWLRTTITFPAAVSGPPGMVNGGWVSGTVAGHLGRGPVEVTLRAPTPLTTPLELRAADDTAVLVGADETLLVAARRSPGPVRAVFPLPWEEAREAGRRYAGHHEHPFPECFVCGPRRRPGDGLRVFPGLVPGDDSRVACVFVPPTELADADGRLPLTAVWGALDCPTAWAHISKGGVALLGRLRAVAHAQLVAGEPYLVVGEATGASGRKLYSRSSVYDAEGRLAGAAEATWIRIDG
jgi:hypothetical protein